MKKVISIILVAVMLMGCFGTLGLAADNYTKAYIVTSADSSKYVIVPYGTDSNYVKEGDPFKFTITEVGSFTMNDTTVVRYVPTDYEVQMLLDTDIEEGTPLYPEKITTTQTDAEGNTVTVILDVYTIPAVNEDTYIYATNVANKSLSGILDFINGLFNFFVNWINWFFGLKKVL